ncbi:hypothetical protein M758_8G047500 [Ceratodon purpureus]|nr:hypothetical protein M758_8G047500 [Ceratodon purpureus]
MAAPTLAYSTELFASFYDAMVESLPPEFEVGESQMFYGDLALKSAVQSDAGVKILDLCTGTGSIPRRIADVWAGRDGKRGSLQIIGVDKSEEMLKVARREWVEVPGVEVEWRRGSLGQRGALAGIEGVDLALISAGSFHHLTTREEQLVTMAEVKECLKPGGLLVLNLFAVDEIIFEVSSGDHGAAEVWHLKDGFWKQTLDKVVDTLKDGGVIGTETFKVGCWKWEEEMVCMWTLRAVWWEDIRDLCEEVGLVIQQEFSSFHDALDGRSAGMEETGESGRIFVIQRQNDSDALDKATIPTSAYNTALFPSFYDAMVASLPPEFEVLESQTFYRNLALSAAPDTDVDVKILDLFTGTGRIPRHIAAAWSTRAGKCRSCGKCRSLQIIGLDNSEEMLKAARRKWMEFPSVDIEWKLGALGQPGALANIKDMDLALISDGSFHLLATHQEQLVAMTEVKNALKVGGHLILNLFAVDELVHDDFSLGDHGGLDIWHMKHGYWKQTLDKAVVTSEDGGMTGTETFKIGCKEWTTGSMVCSWTLRAVWWEDIRELCEEVGLVIQQEFRSFADALCGRDADMEAETGDGGRIFVIQRQS